MATAMWGCVTCKGESMSCVLNHLVVRYTITRHWYVASHMAGIENALPCFKSIGVYERWLTLHVSVGADKILWSERLFSTRQSISWQHSWSRTRHIVRGEIVRIKAGKKTIQLFLVGEVKEWLAMRSRRRITGSVVGWKSHSFDGIIV